MKYHRINIIGGPGLGKSTTSAILFGELKKRNHSIELVSEYVKSWAVQKKQINLFDQNYIFGKQQQYEYRYLSHGIQTVITDSPTLLSTIYTEYHFGKSWAEPLILADNLYETKYPSINIILKREGDYVTEGRYQNEDAAIEIDIMVMARLVEHKRNYKVVLRNNIDDMIEYIEKNIN